MDTQPDHNSPSGSTTVAPDWVDQVLTYRPYWFEDSMASNSMSMVGWENEIGDLSFVLEDEITGFMTHDASTDNQFGSPDNDHMMRIEDAAGHHATAQYNPGSNGLEYVSGLDAASMFPTQTSSTHNTTQVRGPTLAHPPPFTPVPQHGIQRTTPSVMTPSFHQNMTPTHTSPASSTEPSDSEPTIEIGTALANGKFKCNQPSCTRKSFSRLPELRRHHSTVHAVRKPEYWCSVPFCPRGVAAGGQAFRRKYRLRDHMKKIHDGEEGNRRRCQSEARLFR